MLRCEKYSGERDVLIKRPESHSDSGFLFGRRKEGEEFMRAGGLASSRPILRNPGTWLLRVDKMPRNPAEHLQRDARNTEVTFDLRRGACRKYVFTGSLAVSIALLPLLRSCSLRVWE